MATSNGRHLSFPFRIGGDGRTASPETDAEHVRDEVLQLLLTSPGERAFLVEFGGGLRRLAFEPLSDALVAITKARIAQALSRWLGHRLIVERLEVATSQAGDAIEVEVAYRAAGSPDTRVLKFQRTGR